MIALRKKNSNNTMPRRITMVAKNISDISLKRNHLNNNSYTDLSMSKSTFLSSSSLLSSSLSSSSTTVVQQDEIEEDKREQGLIHSNSSLGICTVPRTGSFATELSQRLELSEKKGEPVSQIIPKSNTTTTATDTTLNNKSLRKSAPLLNIDNPSFLTLDSSSMFVLPPLPLHNINKSRKSVPTSASSPSLHIPPPSMKRSTTGTSVHSTASSSSSSISTNQSMLSSTKRNHWHFSQWFTHHPLPPSSTTTTITSSSTLPTIITTTEPSKPCAKKRARIIQELITTEIAYQADMELVKEIYYDFAYEAFSKIEIKQIFTNLLDIIQFEKDFIKELSDSQQNGPEIVHSSTATTISSAFSVMVKVAID